MKKQPYYDRLISFNPNAVSEEEECHVEKQFRKGSAFKFFRLMLVGGALGGLIYLFFAA